MNIVLFEAHMFSYVFKKQKETTPQFEIKSIPFKLCYGGEAITIEYHGKSYKDILCHVSLIVNDNLFDFSFSFSIFSNVFSVRCKEELPLSVELQVHLVENHIQPFVGLENLGATCYINSVIQTIYMLNGFKESLYKCKGYHCGLFQRLFFAMDLVNSEFCEKQISCGSRGSNREMEENSHAVTSRISNIKLPAGNMPVLRDRIHNLIKNLTAVEDLNTHQDAHEFSRKIFELLENENKELVKKLTEGTVVSIVTCEHGCISKRVDPFQDLQMIIKDFYENRSNKTVYESLEEFCRPINIDEFKCEKHGKVKAKRQVLFGKLPPALFILLNRFVAHLEAQNYMKINQKFEFPEELDLTKFMDASENTENGQECNKQHPCQYKYKIFSIIVHSGLVNEGHFYCYMNLGGKYYKFNDEAVHECSKEEAIDWNYGGVYPNNLSREKTFSGYYLVYCRDMKDSLLPNFNVAETVPSNLIESLKTPIEPASVSYVEPRDVVGYCGPGRFNVTDPSYLSIHPKVLSSFASDNITKLFPKKSVFDPCFNLIRETSSSATFYYVTETSSFKKIVFVKIFEEIPWCTYPRNMYSIGEKTIERLDDFKAMSPFDNFCVYREDSDASSPSAKITRIETIDQIKRGDSLIIAQPGSLLLDFLNFFHYHQLVTASFPDFTIPLFLKRNLGEEMLHLEIQKHCHSTRVEVQGGMDKNNVVKCNISEGAMYYVGILSESFDVNHIDHIHQFVFPAGSCVRDLIKKFRKSTFRCMIPLQNVNDIQVLETHKSSANAKILSEGSILEPGMGFLVIQRTIPAPIKVSFYTGTYELLNYPFVVENPKTIQKFRAKYFFTNRIVKFNGKSYVECALDDTISGAPDEIYLIQRL